MSIVLDFGSYFTDSDEEEEILNLPPPPPPPPRRCPHRIIPSWEHVIAELELYFDSCLE